MSFDDRTMALIETAKELLLDDFWEAYGRDPLPHELPSDEAVIALATDMANDSYTWSDE